MYEVAIIKHVTWVGFWVNALLMVLKLAFGYYGHSDALVADGFHSLSDFGTDLIVLMMVGIAYKHADSSHPYGHGKFETFASLLIAVILFAVALGIGWKGIASSISFFNGIELPRPDVWTIIVAVISILGKEWLFRYTYARGKKINSSALKANAWHHRSDAISSIATLIGVSGSYFLGVKFRILDPIASLFIGVFIAVSAYKIARPAVDELLERSLPQPQVNQIYSIISSVDGVLGLHKLKTRRSGHSRIIDVDIKVDPDISVTQGHNIATNVEHTLKDRLGDDLFIYVHVEPFRHNSIQSG
ncbi:MAG: cation diffusion facilitator family transporter [Lachnospiraceae bacterium]|nr:cation diffusion facilitator family transporter [Lachnospiraceae bacterium]